MTDLLTVPEVAEILRKPTGTLRYWRSVGEGPRSMKIGSTVVYERSDLEAWIKAQRDATARGGQA